MSELVWYNNTRSCYSNCKHFACKYIFNSSSIKIEFSTLNILIDSNYFNVIVIKKIPNVIFVDKFYNRTYAKWE